MTIILRASLILSFNGETTCGVEVDVCSSDTKCCEADRAGLKQCKG